MVELDLRAVKDFLWKKNNEEALNLNKLVVVGVEAGAAVALNFAAYDAVGYNQGGAYYGRGKTVQLGDFVKGVVLISPQTKVTGLSTAKILGDREFCGQVAVMILAGEQNPEYFNEASRLNTRFVNARPKVDADTKPKDMTVWFYGKGKVATKLQGAKLLAEPSLKVPEKIAAFMSARVVENSDAKDYVWRKLKLPHE